MLNIVQSFWSKPFFNTHDHGWEGRRAGGWTLLEHYYMSWALSCLLLKKYYGNIELVTDEKGRRLLIDELKLPYDRVTCMLDVLNHYPSELWCIGKIFTYRLQQAPFLHVDSDVFVWEKFHHSLLSASLISQSAEEDFYHERVALQEIFNAFQYLPPAIRINPPSQKLVSCNAGIFGGHNIDFFQQYTKHAFEFIDRNLECMPLINAGLSNSIFEQYLFACLAKEKGVRITYLFDNDPDYRALTGYSDTPHRRKYLHIIGPRKKEVHAEDWISNRLLLEFPEFYYRVKSLGTEFKV